MCIIGMETVTETLLLLVRWVDKYRGPLFTVWPVGGRAGGMRQKPGNKAWVGSVTWPLPSTKGTPRGSHANSPTVREMQKQVGSSSSSREKFEAYAECWPRHSSVQSNPKPAALPLIVHPALPPAPFQTMSNTQDFARLQLLVATSCT